MQSSADSPATGIFGRRSKQIYSIESQVGGKSAKTAISSGLIVSKGPSVAVLPVTNPAKATALEPVAGTITQQLASSLGKFSTLRVMPRATAANFLKQDDTVEAARKAGVDYLVTGEIRPLGEGARASIQVADLHSGTEIWSKSFVASAEGVRTETDAKKSVTPLPRKSEPTPAQYRLPTTRNSEQAGRRAQLLSMHHLRGHRKRDWIILCGSQSARMLETTYRGLAEQCSGVGRAHQRFIKPKIYGIWPGARPGSARRKASLSK